MPKVILLFSGKRKSGKDYLTDHLQKVVTHQLQLLHKQACPGKYQGLTVGQHEAEDSFTFSLKLSEKCEVIKISQPIKSHWAKENNLNLNELLSDSKYKEQYRLKMIKWSEEKRYQDYGCFCKAACQNAADKPVWIVSDIRRKTDIKWFKETYSDLPKIIRITADEETRKSRGFHFQVGVDDAASECDLDDYTDWDLVINNGKNGEKLQEQINSILALLTNVI